MSSSVGNNSRDADPLGVDIALRSVRPLGQITPPTTPETASDN